MPELFDIVLLQTGTEVGFLSQVAQAGIAFTILILIIYVLARRVVKLETRLESKEKEDKDNAKELVLIIKSATDSMERVAKILEKNG